MVSSNVEHETTLICEVLVVILRISVLDQTKRCCLRDRGRVNI